MKNQLDLPLGNILAAYFSDFSSISARPFGSGHINDTFLLTHLSGERYLLQRINHQVFKDVAGLMINIDQVTRQVQRALKKRDDTRFTTLRIISTLEGGLFHLDQSGNYWRIITFIPNSITYDLVTSTEQAFQAGYAFGYFQQLLSDMPGDTLQETIPKFHAMDYRFSNFDKAVEADLVHRVKQATPEIAFALARKQEMLDWQAVVSNPEFPRRVTHNDTKFNNVLLDQGSQRAVGVIDLDTVMPGVIGYDFGDAIRTIANTAEEDEADLSKISVNLDYYRVFAQGFLEESGQQLTELEKKSLHYAPNYMTFIMGLRMLTDYLQGDVYYKTNHSGHNLQRAKAQFELVAQLEKSASQTQQILTEVFFKLGN
ncbi:phosphotransferase enzyme family protein [Tunicatimonas pelagia]|uniref:phosphotransferase enzyme family protein n=1 Tax=Tunicatimonas pelagia TaxID=931531 RepID=UPI002665EA5A|nr:aminoglycoside phosphotransferase family protein [Tunicatimonas pelagia]WKN42793.1 aminoglycoside phosphotransferase family protein [Tunicatimonas pelagia]